MRSPRPGPPVASTSPPAEATTCLTIARPRPVPARGAGTVAAEETLEEARELLLAHAAPVVGSFEQAGASRQVQGGPRPRVTDRVLGEVLGNDLQHPSAERELDVSGCFDSDRDVRTLGAVGEPVADLPRAPGARGVEPSETTSRPLSSSERKRMSSTSSRISSTCSRAWASSASRSASRRAPRTRARPADEPAAYAARGRLRR